MEGVLRVRKDVELDREAIAFYNLTICARDRGVPPLSSTVSLGPLAMYIDSYSSRGFVVNGNRVFGPCADIWGAHLTGCFE